MSIQAFDMLSGTLDGINSEGLTVAIMADEEAIGQLGPRLERHPYAPRVVGLHELQVMRFLLDVCATAGEAEEALLTLKQYYFPVALSDIESQNRRTQGPVRPGGFRGEQRFGQHPAAVRGGRELHLS